MSKVLSKRSHRVRASSEPYHHHRKPESLKRASSVPCQREEPEKVALHIFFNCQTTGPSPFDDEIIEMAAVSAKPGKPFHQDIDCSNDEHTFPAVFKKFDDWVRTTIAELSEEEGCSYYPVLVSHSGSNQHFRTLITEIKCYKLWPFFTGNAEFADSLPYLRQERKHEDSILKDYKSLGLQNLVEEIFYSSGYEHCSGCEHRSAAALLADNLKLIFTSPKSPLKPLLSAMPAKTYPEQLKLWDAAKQKSETKKVLKEIRNKIVFEKDSCPELELVYSRYKQCN